jgi:hypothetical protein
MKAKCVKSSVPNPTGKILNPNLELYLSINSSFSIFGIRFCQNISYLYIFNGNHLFEAPIEMFEITDDSVSSQWKIKIWENGEITLWPGLFYQHGFLENFAERESKERCLFKELQIKIEE